MIVRALVARGGVEATLGQATLALIVGAAVGLVLGSIAEMTVRDSVRAIIADQLQQSASTPAPRR